MSEDGISILVVEDDEKLASQIQRYLVQQGFNVAIESSGVDAPKKVRDLDPDIVILDIMLPGLDGFSVCREIRSDFSGDILMLTASEDDMDQVAGLEMGADDYVIKPVHPRVLLARIRLLLRKRSDNSSSDNTSTESSDNKELSFGELCIHPIQRSVTLSKELIALTPSEFDILLYLALRAEQTVSRDSLLKMLRGIEYDGLDRSVDVKVANLRKKLKDNPSYPNRIITVRGKGYLFVPDSW